MKRETTPTLPVRIGAVYDESIQSIEFIFKQDKSADDAILLHKSYTSPDLPVGDCDDTGFTLLVAFSLEDMSALPVGKIYMDTRITYSDGTIPETEIVSLFINETLFNTEAMG